jgi:uncharacterized protein YeaO (DUF488 family)
MEIYTSYFAQSGKIPSNYVKVAICGKAPDWYKGVSYKKLAPTYDILMQYKETKDTARYQFRYRTEVLSKLNEKEVVDELTALANGADGVVLLCYEKPTDFCHRNIVSSWLSTAGYRCQEMKF